MIMPTRDPARNREHQMRYYYAHREEYNQRRAATKRGQVLQAKVMAYLDEHPCVDCGEADPVVLEFDHVRGKKVASVSLMVREVRSWALIEAEIAKCDVRCANCHRRVTARRAGWYRVPATGVEPATS